MSENNIETQVNEAITKARSNLENSRLTIDAEQELRNMINSIDGKAKQLMSSRAQLSNFIQEHTATIRM